MGSTMSTPQEELIKNHTNANSQVIGFNMLGSRWNHTVLERWILERRTLADAVERLAEAQFDVEFGRADLRGLRQAFQNQEGRP